MTPIPDGLEPLARFALLCVRPLAALALLPPLAGAGLPWRVRLALAAALALFASAHVAPVPIDGATLAGEVLAGLLLGLGIAAAFGAATFAGEVAGQMLGLGFAGFAGPAGSPTALAGLYAMLMWLALLTTGAAGELFGAMAGGFDAVAPGAVVAGGAGTAVELGLALFGGGLRLALPIVGVLFLGNLLLAVVTRSAPAIGGLAVGPVGLLLLLMAALPLVFDDLLLRAGDVLAQALA